MATTTPANNRRRHNVEGTCTCGTRYGLTSSTMSGPQRSTPPPAFLDASFVHLPPSLLVQQEDNEQRTLLSSSSSLERYKHLETLQETAASKKSSKLQLLLCLDCVQRVERALQVDTERIEAETTVYRNVIRDEQVRQNNWKRRMTDTASSSSLLWSGQESQPQQQPLDNNKISPRVEEVERAKQSFQAEIDGLEEVCRKHQEELQHLESVRAEQARISRELDQAEEYLHQERNNLRVEARAFYNDQEQFFRILSEIENESEGLSSTAIRLPSLLLDLQVDRERGLRYPYINDLRLAYRPKGDVQWEEIQAALSLAAQLLLYVGTLFHFQSRHWRIVPLSSCAKLIFYPTQREGVVDPNRSSKSGAVVYNLGHPRTHSSRAFLAWNALLHQLASCVLGKMNQAVDDGLMEASMVPRLPYEMTSVEIGSIALTELDYNDDAGWSRAIHCMSCNLLWLSDCASVFVLHQIRPQCSV